MSLTLPVDAAPGRLAVAAIAGYQRYLSPHKGFVCAHRVRHGGASCSEHIKRVIIAEGLFAGLRALRPRLRACRDAASALREERARRTLATTAGREFDEEFDLPPGKPGAGPAPASTSADCGQGAGHLLDGCYFLPDPCGCDVPGMDFGPCDIPGVDCGGCG